MDVEFSTMLIVVACWAFCTQTPEWPERTIKWGTSVVATVALVSLYYQPTWEGAVLFLSVIWAMILLYVFLYQKAKLTLVESVNFVVSLLIPVYLIFFV